jgi:hypothetical protein
MLKTMIVMFLAISAGTVGDILLAKGMKQMGDISAMNLRGIMDTAFRALTNPKLIFGSFSGWRSSPGRTSRWLSPCRPSITSW